jgi:lipid II:glycine glycyltransferase (peptidoglycan interpeptide bridge formation enzyme)
MLDDARADAGVDHVEVRCALPPPARPASSGAVAHRCPLPAAAAELRSTVNGSHRRGAVVASRRGVVLRTGERCHDLAEAFYTLHVGTRRRHGVPVQPRRYFELLWDRVLARDLGLLLLAEVDGEPVAGGVFLAWRGTFIHKYSASDALAWPRHANDLLLWEALTWAVEHGCTQVDFGRSDLADTGLRDFKRAWGGREEPLVYSTVGKPARDSRGRLARVARPVLRHGPVWLTRVTGEVLYRYAA